LRREQQRSQPHSLRILGAGVRREAPHPVASGGRCPEPDGPPGVAVVVVTTTEACSASR